MDGITLSFTDARPVLAPGALEEQVRAAAPLLAEAAAGEERYRDNLGWHSVDGGGPRHSVGGQHHLRLRDGPHSAGVGRISIHLHRLHRQEL